jgi:hypothetical protein
MKERDYKRDYENTTIVFSKPLYYGGRNFIKYNALTKKYHTGNTASTAYNTNDGLYIHNVTTKQIKDIARQLNNRGYSEFKEQWNTKVDTYEQIKRAGL